MGSMAYTLQWFLYCSSRNEVTEWGKTIYFRASWVGTSGPCHNCWCYKSWTIGFPWFWRCTTSSCGRSVHLRLYYYQKYHWFYSQFYCSFYTGGFFGEAWIERNFSIITLDDIPDWRCAIRSPYLLLFSFFQMHPFLSQLLQNLTSIGVDLSGLTIDHIAYRASSVAEWNMLKAEWNQQYSLLKSAEINGREVLVYACQPPLQYDSWSIPSLELMYPKPSKTYGGWDHIEVVLWPYSVSIDDLRGRLLGRFPDIQKNAWETYTYEEDGLHSVGGQVLNPAITLRFPDRTAVRFHTADIREIIAMEE